MRLGSGGAQAAFLRSPGGGGRYGLKNMASGGGGGVTLITPAAFMIASLSFGAHAAPGANGGGICEFGSQFPRIIDTSDTINGGNTYGVTAPVNGIVSRFGKILDPNGGGFPCIRHAAASTDPISANTPNAHRSACDPAWTGPNGGMVDGTGYWSTARLFAPSNLASLGRFVYMDEHGSNDGGQYCTYNETFLNTLQIVRDSNGSGAIGPTGPFSDNQLPMPSAGVWYDLTRYVFLDITGSKSYTAAWINGGDVNGNPQFVSTEINSTSGNSPYYPKVDVYDGNVAWLLGYAWHCYRAVLWFFDGGTSQAARQYAFPQIRGQLSLY